MYYRYFLVKRKISCLPPKIQPQNKRLSLKKKNVCFFHRSGFPGLRATDVQGWIILWGGGCPAHHGILSSVPGLHPLDSKDTLSSAVTAKNVSRHGQMSPEGQNTFSWAPLEEVPSSKSKRYGEKWNFPHSSRPQAPVPRGTYCYQVLMYLSTDILDKHTCPSVCMYGCVCVLFCLKHPPQK